MSNALELLDIFIKVKARHRPINCFFCEHYDEIDGYCFYNKPCILFRAKDFLERMS